MSTRSIYDVFREGNLTKVLELITKGFNMNIKYVAGETTYSEDPATGRYVEVRYMETPLTACVANGRQSCVNLLLAAGTDVNFPDSLGLTPLMHAVVNDQLAMQTIFTFMKLPWSKQWSVVNSVQRSSFSSKVQSQTLSYGATKQPSTIQSRCSILP